MSSLRNSPIKRLQLFGKDSHYEIVTLTHENQRLSAMIHTKNLQIKELLDENKLMKMSYEEQIAVYQNTITVLESQLAEVQRSRGAEFEVIRERYEKMSVEESQNMKSYHSHQIEFLLKEIAHLRVDSAAKDEKINLKQRQMNSMKQSYEREIEDKINEINNLNRSLLSISQHKNKEIKQLSSKRQLQKSRTSGIVSSRKENNQFIDKQLRKLNEQVLDKAIRIENFTRDMNKIKKKLEETERSYSKRIEELIAEREDENREREQHYAKIQKSLKSEILEYKSKQMQLLGEVDTLKDQNESLKNQIARNADAIKSKEQEIKDYKNLLEKQREEHVKEISNLMKERKKKSSNNLGSSRSLGSSLKETPIIDQSNSGPIPIKKNDSCGLPIVREQSPDKSMYQEMERSNVTDEVHEEQENQLAHAVYHYDTLIEELKRSHSSQIELLKHKINKISKNFEDKQQEVLDILTRFSPLVKIHAEEKSVEEDRKERIQRHWKADLALLQILLDKYKIKAFE